MKALSPAKIKATQIQQVCVVCNDLQKTMEAYWNILGIGPWAVFEFGSRRIPDLEYYGKPAWGRYLGSVSQVGPIELELFQTLEGASVYQDWINEHGEGLHHMKFLTEDLDIDRIKDEMEKLGFPVIQGGHFGPELKNQFAYFDLQKPLKAIWETSNRTGGKPIQATIFPEDINAANSARVKVNEIKQVGICVKDVIKTAENYWNILGIGPWEIREWGSYVLFDRCCYGKPAWGRERLAHAYIGELELELVQFVEGDSIYADWIEGHGEGIQHLKFLCSDIDETSNLLKEQGFFSLQSGHFGDPKEKAGGFNYIDVPPLHCILEPVHKPKSLPAEPVAHIPPE
jgi:hypothetical protein